MFYVFILVSWRKMERNIIQYLFYVWLDNLFLRSVFCLLRITVLLSVKNMIEVWMCFILGAMCDVVYTSTARRLIR